MSIEAASHVVRAALEYLFDFENDGKLIIFCLWACGVVALYVWWLRA